MAELRPGTLSTKAIASPQLVGGTTRWSTLATCTQMVSEHVAADGARQKGTSEFGKPFYLQVNDSMGRLIVGHAP